MNGERKETANWKEELAKVSRQNQNLIKYNPMDE